MDTGITQFDLTQVVTPPIKPESETKPSEDKKSGEELSPGIQIAAGKSWTSSLVFSPDGERLFASDHTGLLLAWSFPCDDAKQTPLWNRQAHQGWLRAIAISPDGQMLATCGNDDQVRLWLAESGEPIGEIVGHDCDVYQVAFHPAGEHLVSTDVKGAIKHWNVNSKELVREMDMRFMFKEEGPIRVGGARSISFDSTGSLLACGGLSRVKRVNSPQGIATAVLIDWETGKQKYVLLPQGNTDGFMNGLAFHPAGFIVGATGGASSRAGNLLFWKLPEEQSASEDEKKAVEQSPTTTPADLKTFHEFKMATSGWAMDLHPDGRHIAVAHHDAFLRYYDLTPTPAKTSD